MVGSGETVTGADTDFDVSATDVAWTVTVMFAETDAGALYVTPDAVLLVKVPQALPLHDVPDMAQVTPLLLESLVTVAANFNVCPRSILVWADGLIETEIGGGAFAELPPQAPRNNNPNKTVIAATTFTLGSARTRCSTEDRWLAILVSSC